MVSIVDCIRQENYTFHDSCIGIISPTYNWALPSITREFLQKAELKADYLYYVATYGTSPGASSEYAEKYLGQKIQAFYSVRMPDTWTPVLDLSTPEKVAKFSNCTFVNDVRLKKRRSYVRDIEFVDEGRVKPDRSQQTRGDSNSCRFWIGDFQSRTDMGMRLDRRK